MPYLNMESLKQMVRQKAEQKGLGFLWPLIDYIVNRESSWNPSVQSSARDPGTGQRENSWGLFQCLIDSSMGPGLGANYTPEQLQDPEINAEIALEHIRKQLEAGVPLQQAVDDWTVTHGIDVTKLVQGGAGMVQETTGMIPPEMDRVLEDIWNRQVQMQVEALQAGRYVQREVLTDEELLERAETLVAGEHYTKENWKLAQLPMYGMQPQLPEDTDEWNRALEELNYQVEVKGWPVEKAAAEFANRISAATVGGTLAQTAEQIRTSQMQRRMPAPNVPGGYQPIDPAQFTKYGMTAPQPVPVQPATFPDPWSEIQRGMETVGPTALPEMEYPPFPGGGAAGAGGGAESAIIQAYNAITGGGAPTPAAQGMGPTPDILAQGMVAPPPGPTPDVLTRGMAPPVQGLPSQWQPGMTSPPPMPWELWEELYGGR